MKIDGNIIDVVDQYIKKARKEGYAAGYRAAVDELTRHLAAQEVEQPVKVTSAQETRRQKVLDYLAENPGTTAHQMSKQIGINSGFPYGLAQRGMIVRMGSKFYLPDQTAK